MNTPIVVMVTDDGTLTWQEADPEFTGENHDSTDIIAGGWLFGPTRLTALVRLIMEEKSVPVTWSRYEFTENRDTPADVVAAMYATGMGRGVLNDVGWGILNEAMPELTDPENNIDGVIY